MWMNKNKIKCLIENVKKPYHIYVLIIKSVTDLIGSKWIWVLKKVKFNYFLKLI